MLERPWRTGQGFPRSLRGFHDMRKCPALNCSYKVTFPSATLCQESESPQASSTLHPSAQQPATQASILEGTASRLPRAAAGPGLEGWKRVRMRLHTSSLSWPCGQKKNHYPDQLGLQSCSLCLAFRSEDAVRFDGSPTSGQRLCRVPRFHLRWLCFNIQNLKIEAFQGCRVRRRCGMK